LLIGLVGYCTGLLGHGSILDVTMIILRLWVDGSVTDIVLVQMDEN